jgi:ABC-type transporter Mla maintaining outer membrane lipid asymmetry ATPase subunit MlaF
MVSLRAGVAWSASRRGAIPTRPQSRPRRGIRSSFFDDGSTPPVRPFFDSAVNDTESVAEAEVEVETDTDTGTDTAESPPDNRQPLIEFRDVHKSFGNKHILRGCSFCIYPGESVGIIGSSGTGKSTTLRLAAGLLEPDAGQIIIKGRPRQGLLSDDDTSDKLKIGLVFQSGALFDSLSVKENVGFMLYEHTTLPEEDIECSIRDALSKVGLSGVENLYPSELSGGMKKRVALARAIVQDKSSKSNVEQVIMYDEPTAGLDPVASTVVEDLIRSMHDPKYCSVGENVVAGNGSYVLQEGCGVSSYVVVTHQHSTIRRSVDRIIFLHGGTVVWEGTVGDFETTREPIVRQFREGSLDGPIAYV